MSDTYQPTPADGVRLLVLLTVEGVEYLELLSVWGQAPDAAHQLQQTFAELVLSGVAEQRGALYCLRPGEPVAAAQAKARAMVEGLTGAPTVAERGSVPSLTPAQARALLLVSLEAQTVSEIADRLADRGHVPTLGDLKRDLDRLTRAGLLECTPGKGKRGNTYRLSSGEAVEAALDRAYELTRATAAA